MGASIKGKRPKGGTKRTSFAFEATYKLVHKPESWNSLLVTLIGTEGSFICNRLERNRNKVPILHAYTKNKRAFHGEDSQKSPEGRGKTEGEARGPLKFGLSTGAFFFFIC
jgi:hypothetical protein